MIAQQTTPDTLDRTVWELANARGPFVRGALCRVGRAVHAAGGTETEDGAHELVWEAMSRLDPQAPMREALELAGLDAKLVEAQLEIVELHWSDYLHDERHDQERESTRAMNAARAPRRRAAA